MAKTARTTKRSSPLTEPTAPRDSPLSVLFYRTHALLESVRSVAAHEDELCTLLNELKQAREVDALLVTELRQLLREMPVAACEHDLEQVLDALPVTTPAARSASAKPSVTKTGAARKGPARQPGKRARATAKRTGRRT